MNLLTGNQQLLFVSVAFWCVRLLQRSADGTAGNHIKCKSEVPDVGLAPAFRRTPPCGVVGSRTRNHGTRHR